MSVRIKVAMAGRYLDQDWAKDQVVEIEDPAQAERMLKLEDQIGSHSIHPFVRDEEPEASATELETGQAETGGGEQDQPPADDTGTGADGMEPAAGSDAAEPAGE